MSWGRPSFVWSPRAAKKAQRTGEHMQTVLIVEDDLLIADLLRDMLAARSYVVCGIARTVDDAMRLAGLHAPDLAVIDVNLAHGAIGTDFARRLGNLGNLGILYTTGNRSRLSLGPADGHACLSKPYRCEDLIRSLQLVKLIVETGAAPRPYPRGFHPLDPGLPILEAVAHG
jgi:CheY-like chemotaxis protein